MAIIGSGYIGLEFSDVYTVSRTTFSSIVIVVIMHPLLAYHLPTLSTGTGLGGDLHRGS